MNSTILQLHCVSEELYNIQYSILSILKIPSWLLRHSACSLLWQSFHPEILYKKS